MNEAILISKEDGVTTFEYRGHIIKRYAAKKGLNAQAQPWTGRKVNNGVKFISYYNGERIAASDKTLANAISSIEFCIRRDSMNAGA